MDTQFEHPEDIVRRGLYNHISSLPFKAMEIPEFVGCRIYGVNS